MITLTIAHIFLNVFGKTPFSCSSTKHLNSKNTVANDFESELHIDRKHIKNPFFEESDKEEKWVDSVYNQMTFNEKVGQLFMVAAYSNKDSIHVNSIDKLIKECIIYKKLLDNPNIQISDPAAPTIGPNEKYTEDKRKG